MAAAMHALSLGTWWIHIASVLEWIAAIVAIQRFGVARCEGGWRWLSLAMVPALASAMAACTWHLFDNSTDLKGLVVLQAGLTTLGNLALAIAAWNLLRRQRLGLDGAPLMHPGTLSGEDDPPPAGEQVSGAAVLPAKAGLASHAPAVAPPGQGGAPHVSGAAA
jgi:hypothetical protein